MPQGHPRAFAQKHRAILMHGHPLFSRKGPKASIATWNLRSRLGQGNWGESTWLKLKKMTGLATATLRQMSLGRAAGEDEVTAELLKFGGGQLVGCSCSSLSGAMAAADRSSSWGPEVTHSNQSHIKMSLKDTPATTTFVLIACLPQLFSNTLRPC